MDPSGLWIQQPQRLGGWHKPLGWALSQLAPWSTGSKSVMHASAALRPVGIALDISGRLRVGDAAIVCF